jgi:hypothetical protein
MKLELTFSSWILEVRAMNAEERKQLLFFTTGNNWVPVGGFGYTQIYGSTLWWRYIHTDRYIVVKFCREHMYCSCSSGGCLLSLGTG